METGSKILLTAVFAFIVVTLGGLLWYAATLPTHVAPVNATSEQKPLTKTRCDFTGMLAPQIIEEERSNGYVFTGRINTLLCGESGLSFNLEQ
jgi:hypothetical protein